MYDPAVLRHSAFIAPPAVFRVGTAQVDETLDAVPCQERAEKSGISLRRPRGLSRHDPMEIVEDVAGPPHGACVAVHAIIRNRTALGGLVPLKALLQRWQWTTLLAIAAFAVLYSLDTGLKAATGFGTVDLQSAQTSAEYNQIFSSWLARQHSATAGFSLGFDFLFIFLYVYAFYYSAIIAREAFANKGLARRAANYVAFVPLAGALADAVENALEFSMMIRGANDSLARLAFLATSLKTVCFTVGLVLLVAALAGFFKLRVPKKAGTD